MCSIKLRVNENFQFVSVSQFKRFSLGGTSWAVILSEFSKRIDGSNMISVQRMMWITDCTALLPCTCIKLIWTEMKKKLIHIGVSPRSAWPGHFYNASRRRYCCQMRSLEWRTISKLSTFEFVRSKLTSLRVERTIIVSSLERQQLTCDIDDGNNDVVN